MLRTTLEVEMIYELTLNDREMKIDDKMYDFQSKIETLNEKLAKLNKIVEEKHILVSSNKGLIMLKEQKIAFDKAREEAQKKIGLLRNNIAKSETGIKKDMDQMRKEIIEKETRYVTIEKEL
jgi:GTPase involved in cell partitioning and DNA repair